MKNIALLFLFAVSIMFIASCTQTQNNTSPSPSPSATASSAVTASATATPSSSSTASSTPNPSSTSTAGPTVDPSSLTWTLATVHSSAASGQFSVIAIDGNNKVHIAHYGTGELMHSTNASGSWVTEVIENTQVSECISIAVDGANGLHVSYYASGSNLDLKYAYKASGGSWSTTTVDSAGTVGQYNSIGVDSNNKAHIAYGDITNGYLKYATNKSGAWLKEVVDSSATGQVHSSIAVESPTKIHISYTSSGNKLDYVSGEYGSWPARTTVDSGGTVRDTSIKLDSAKRAHVSYYFYGSEKQLKHATNSSGSWVSEAITNSYIGDGGDTSIVIDANNNPYISYYKYFSTTSSALKIAIKLSGAWNVDTIDDGSEDDEIGLYSSIALDSHGRVHIAYQQGYGSDLKYALGQ